MSGTGPKACSSKWCTPQKIELLWNRPESLFLQMVQDVRSNQ
ncbi:hypothetical protein QUA83_07925 [Microcoleus sp. K1-B1]